jgi:hypothetical protein
MQIITGRELCSASRYAWTCRSTASWLELAKTAPAGVAHRHRVGVVVPDVDRRTDRTVRHGHHDRQAEAGGVEKGLGHEQQGSAGRGGVRTCAHRGGADASRHGGELGLDHEVLAGSQLTQVRTRSDSASTMWVCGEIVEALSDLGTASRHRLRDRARSLDLAKHATVAPSRRRHGRRRPRPLARLPPPHLRRRSDGWRGRGRGGTRSPSTRRTPRGERGVRQRPAQHPAGNVRGGHTQCPPPAKSFLELP